ncbi:hypothetical protein M2302_003822 [Micromonospora sp. A200]|nr:hypothetical protein [Micromonospora sp. A200]
MDRLRSPKACDCARSDRPDTLRHTAGVDVIAQLMPAADSAAQRAFFVARLRGGVNRSAIAAIADGS